MWTWWHCAHTNTGTPSLFLPLNFPEGTFPTPSLYIILQLERGNSLSPPSRPDQTGLRALGHTRYLANALGDLTTSATHARCQIPEGCRLVLAFHCWYVRSKFHYSVCVCLCEYSRVLQCSPRKVLEMYSDTWLPDRLISDRWLSSRFNILLNWRQKDEKKKHWVKWLMHKIHISYIISVLILSRGIKHFLLFSTDTCPMRSRPVVFSMRHIRDCLCLFGADFGKPLRHSTVSSFSKTSAVNYTSKMHLSCKFFSVRQNVLVFLCAEITSKKINRRTLQPVFQIQLHILDILDMHAHTYTNAHSPIQDTPWCIPRTQRTGSWPQAWCWAVLSPWCSPAEALYAPLWVEPKAALSPAASCSNATKSLLSNTRLR